MLLLSEGDSTPTDLVTNPTMDERKETSDRSCFIIYFIKGPIKHIIRVQYLLRVQ